MDVNDIYSGILSPGGGLYSPQGSGVYSGILPDNTTRSITGGSSTLKPPTKVKTVPVDKNGNPITSKTPAKHPFATNSAGQSYKPAAPNETYVPGGMPSWGGVPSAQSGYVPGSYRLLPTEPVPAGSPAAMAAAQAAAGKPKNWMGMGVTLPAGIVGMGSAALPFGGTYDGGGMLAPGVADPWADMQTPGAAHRVPFGAAPGGLVQKPTLDVAVQALIDAITKGSTPDTNKVIGTINKSSDPKASREQVGQAMGDQIRKSAKPSYNVSGGNNSFAPKSVQNSVRWQTGY